MHVCLHLHQFNPLITNSYTEEVPIHGDGVIVLDHRILKINNIYTPMYLMSKIFGT